MSPGSCVPAPHPGHSAELAELPRCWNQEDSRDCRRGKMVLVFWELAWAQTDLASTLALRSHHLHKRNRGIQGLLNNVQHGSCSYCPFPLFFIPSKLYYLTCFCEAFSNSLCNCGILLASCALFFYTALSSQFSYFSFCSTICSQIIYFLFLPFICLQQRLLFPSLLLLSPQERSLNPSSSASVFFPESCSSETSEKLMVTTIAVQVPMKSFIDSVMELWEENSPNWVSLTESARCAVVGSSHPLLFFK